ncbi:MAG: hypothetical protein IJ897_09015 [Prevotella sp.]|nr:hypothetical protein [Prevotella sp.]
MEMKVIKCPNCGANAKNHTNCEYCGSLLVRFVDKGIDISNTSYKSDVDVLPGLVYDLQKNLKIQKELKGEPVETQVFWCDKDSKWSECDRWDSLRIASPNSYFYNGSQINTEKAVALVLVLNIPLINNELDTSKNAFNEKGKKLIEEFKQLASYPLFQSKMSEEFSDNGVKWNIWEYYINFGKDVIGAARLTSEILVKLYDIKGYSIYTNEGYAIEEAKEDFLSENGFNDENSENIDNESDYSEDQEDKGLEDWQKIFVYLLSGPIGLCIIENLPHFTHSNWYYLIACILLLIVLGLFWIGRLPKKYFYFFLIPYFILPICFLTDFKMPKFKWQEQKESSDKVELLEKSNEKEQIEEIEQTPKKSRKDEIRELGYNDGVKFGYSDGGDALRDYVQMGTTLENGLSHIQNVIARTAYKEDYGDNISEALLDEYCKQFIEGYKSIVIKK